jgi:hypothetical protein
MNLRNLILHNFVWKLISVMLAALVWWQVTQILEANRRSNEAAANLPPTRDFTLTVRVMTPALEPRGFSVTPSQVKVTVRGRAALLDGLSPDSLQVYVDVATLRDPKGAATDVIVNTPDEVTVVKVTPRQVYVARF